MNKLSWMFATAAAALLAVPAAGAADKPTVELTPFVGYRMGGQFDVVNPPTGYDDSVDVEDGASWGIDLGIYRDPTSFYELLYSQQSVGFDTNQPGLEGADVKIEYFQLGGTLLFPREQWLVPYLSLTIGATRFDVQGGGSKSSTNFSGSLGGGVRVPVSSNFALNFGLRGYVTAVDSDSEFLCVSAGGNANCLIRSSGSAFFQGEASLGFTASF